MCKNIQPNSLSVCFEIFFVFSKQDFLSDSCCRFQHQLLHTCLSVSMPENKHSAPAPCLIRETSRTDSNQAGVGASPAFLSLIIEP